MTAAHRWRRRLGLCCLALMTALPAAAITNGSADGDAHPEVGAMVADRPNADGTWTYCTGTLVSPTVFLTAAHCGEKGQKTAKVTFSAQYKPGSALHSGRFIPDPRFNDKSDLHDMAVVVFDQPVTGIRPAQRPYRAFGGGAFRLRGSRPRCG